MKNILNPDRYTGRCAEQVDALVAGAKRLTGDLDCAGAEIDLQV